MNDEVKKNTTDFGLLFSRENSLFSYESLKWMGEKASIFETRSLVSFRSEFVNGNPMSLQVNGV